MRQPSASNYATNTLAHDAAGNLTFDGVQKYTYDAWNRLIEVAKAYRDSGGTLQSGSTWITMAYDGRGRRITKAITGTGSLDCTYHYYYDRDSEIERRNGSDQPVKLHVWGLTYIDELVQIVNTDLELEPHKWADGQLLWSCQDANYNVLGVVDGSGVLIERYEYTPYGQRTVFFSAGTNEGAYSPTYASRRVYSFQNLDDEPWGVSDVGHQGLVHDEETGLVYNRARTLHPGLGRFVHRDPLGFTDGSSLYQYLRSAPTRHRDPTGMIPNPMEAIFLTLVVKAPISMSAPLSKQFCRPYQ